MKTTKKLITLFMAVLMLTSLFAINATAAVSIPSDAVTYNGHSYKVYFSKNTWTKASTYCNSVGGHLVTIENSSENNYVKSLITGNDDDIYCIGIYNANGATDKQKGHITWSNPCWINNEIVSYANWDDTCPLLPCNGLKNLICNYGYTFVNGKWDTFENDATNSDYDINVQGFICEWDTTSTSYTATFKDNNGIKTVTGQNITAPSISSKSGWVSVGWTTTSGVPATVTVSAGNAYVLTSNKTFYALYKKDVTLSYNANGGSGAPSSQTQTVQYNACGLTQTAIFNVSSSKPTRDGYKFLGWSTNKNAKTADIETGQRVELSDNNSTTLYAVWEANTNPDPTPSGWDSFVAFFRNIWNWFINLFR